MNGKHVIGVLAAGLMGFSIGPVCAQSSNLDGIKQQAELVNQIADKFQADAAAENGAGFNALEWRRDFGARLMYQPVASLQAALSTANLATAQSVLNSSSAHGKPVLKHAADDFWTIHMITPCRVLDTRFGGGGIFPGGVWRGYTASTPTAATIAAQGGNAAGCGNFPNADGFLLYVTVVPPGPPGGGANFLTIQHTAAPTPPTTSTMNYYPAVNLANFAISACNGCLGGTGDVEIYTSGSTHVIVDMLGWTGTIGPLNLDCNTVTNSFNIPASGVGGAFFSVSSGNCAAGFAVTGGGLNTNFSSATLYYYNSSPDPVAAPTHWRCEGRNVDFNATFPATCNVICCRIPAIQ